MNELEPEDGSIGVLPRSYLRVSIIGRATGAYPYDLSTSQSSGRTQRLENTTLRTPGEESSIAPNTNESFTVALPQSGVEPIFTSDLMELRRLLIGAAEIEHALIVQYLYAWFSIKEEFPLLRFGSDSFKQLAEQEMGHLLRINNILCEIGAKPHFQRQELPFQSDVYPFPFELRRLDGHSLARFICAEAPKSAADLLSNTGSEEREFAEKLRKYLNDEVPKSQIHSLYDSLIVIINKPTINDHFQDKQVKKWAGVLGDIRSQGTSEHFNFLRSVFMQSHHAFKELQSQFPNSDLWACATLDRITFPCPDTPSLYSREGFYDSQAPKYRDLAWLFNLNYWLMLALLECRYHFDSVLEPKTKEVLRNAALSVMTGPLACIGLALAQEHCGAPFDQPQGPLLWGPDFKTCIQWLCMLAREIAARESIVFDGQLKLQGTVSNIASALEELAK
jgi:hypothetical protein